MSIRSVLVFFLASSLSVCALPSTAQSVQLLRQQVNQVAVEVAEGDKAGAQAAADAAYASWQELPPAVQRTIERANPGTEEKLRNLDEEAIAQIEAQSDSSADSSQTSTTDSSQINVTPRPVARYSVAKQRQASNSSTTQSGAQSTTVTTSSGAQVPVAGAAYATTSQSGSTSSLQTGAAGGAYNPSTGNWVAGVHRGHNSATQNSDGSYDTSHSGQSTVVSSAGSAEVDHSGTGDDLGSGSGSYSTQTSVSTSSGQSYQNSTDIWGNSGLGQSSRTQPKPSNTKKAKPSSKPSSGKSGRRR